MKGPNMIVINGIEHIQCRGEILLHSIVEFPKPRARKVAKWVLRNAVSTISGPTEDRLRRFLHDNALDLIPGILQTLREFNHRVPV